MIPSKPQRSSRRKSGPLAPVRQSAFAIEWLETRRLFAALLWTASTSGEFNNPANWNTGTAPGPADDVQINTPGITVTLSAGDVSTVNNLITSTPIVISGGSLTIAAGATLSSTTLTVGAANLPGTLIFQGTQVLGGTGNVTFGANAGNAVRVIDGSSMGAVLTIGGGITLNGGTGSVEPTVFDASIINSGTIDADTAGGTIAFASASAGTSSVINNGTLTATAGELDLGGLWTNNAAISVSGTGILGLGGSFAASSLATLTNTGGTVNITGTMDNTVGSLALSTTTGNVNLAGGMITGGTISSSGGAALVLVGTTSTLSAVTLGAGSPLDATHGAATITGGLTLTSTTLDVGGATTAGELDFKGSQSIGGTGNVVFGAAGGSSLQAVDFNGIPTTLSIGAGVTIDGQNGAIAAQQSDGSISNGGTVSADVVGGTLTISPGKTGTFSNDGTLGASDGATLDINGNLPGGAGLPTNIDIGIGAGGAGQVNIAGVANLGGALNITLLNGFIPPQGNNYNLLTFASSIGAFATVNGLTSPGVVLTASAGSTVFALGVTMGALPDLAFGGASNATLSGGMVNLTATAENIGAATAGPFSVAVVLSADAVFGNSDDIPLTTTQIGGLAPGASQPLSLSAAVPAGTPVGTYNVLAMIDSGNAITESNEANNVLVATGSIVVTPGPAKIGGLDPDFGIGGLASHNVGFTSTSDLLVQSDGKSVIIGISGAAGTQQFGITRYNADGSLDTAFGTNGVTTTSVGGDDTAAAGFLLPGGNILVAGTATTITSGQPAGSQFALAEYTPAGVLDTSFGGGAGFVLASFSSTPGTLSNDVVHALTVSPGGEIFVAGSSDASGNGLDFAIAAFNSDGTPAAGFGTAGQVQLDFSGGDDSISSVALQSNGDIVAAGSSVDPSTGVSSVAVVRLLPSGPLDKHFGSQGGVITSVRGVDDSAASVAIDSRKRIVVGGYSATGSAAAGTLSTDFLVLRYTPSGKLDHSFGHGGVVITSFNQPAAVTRVLVAPSGAVTAAGKTAASLAGLVPAELDLAVARYNAKGQLDPSFNGTGTAIFSLAAPAAPMSLHSLGNPQEQPATLGAAATVAFDTASDLMAEFNQLTQSAQGVAAMTSSGELADVGNSDANTVEAEIITMGEDLAATLTTTLPSAVVGGAKGTLSVFVKETGNVQTGGSVTIDLFAAVAQQPVTGQTPFQSVPEKLKLKPGQGKSFHLKFSYPSSLVDGNYFVVAVVDTGAVRDLDTTNNNSPSAAPVNIAKPFIDLSGGGLSAPLFTGTKPSVVSFAVKNNGNVPAVATSAVEFFASVSDTLADAIPLATVPVKFKLKAGAPGVFKVKLALPPGLPANTYSLLAMLDPNNVFNDTDMSNNLLFSSNTFIVG